MRTRTLCLLILVFGLAFVGCRKEQHDNDGPVEAYQPVYMQRTAMENVFSDVPHTMENPGKIYYKDNFIFVNERGKGVHVLDNTDPASPVNIGFINIPGNWDMAVKNTTLYVDNAVDLLAINIADPTNIVIESRVKDAFPVNHFPDEFGIRFECVDESRGIVVGWQLTELVDPKCWR